MTAIRFGVAALALVLVACKSGEKETLADLRNVKLELKDERVEDGLEKAMESYRRFLAETPETAMTPEAIRRLADLKVEKEYGISQGAAGISASVLVKPGTGAPASAAKETALAAPVEKRESQKEFEKRAAAVQSTESSAQSAGPAVAGAESLENAGAQEAVDLYLKLLAKYPRYERNDQVLYQLSRAYEELGRVDDAMAVMNRLVQEYPRSRYIDEVQFRRGEFYFTRKKFLDAEDAYKAVVEKGAISAFYELALYKLGWTLYKQEMYEEAMGQFVALLDYKVSVGYDFEGEKSGTGQDKERVDDTFRVISLGFSNLGGASSVMDYFAREGKRPYEANIYGNLGEHYLEKQRYSDAAATFKAFVKNNPYHRASPRFDMRVIETYKLGGFPKLVVEANREFAGTYGLKSSYWKHFDVKSYPEVLGYLKTNLRELANHYHALYQDPRQEKVRQENFAEADKWYREFLESFPREPESPGINYQMADLLLEDRQFAKAAREYERTAYDYGAHEKAPAAGYAAVYAWRQAVGARDGVARETTRREVIRSSLRFAEAYPAHDKAALVLGAAVDDLYEMKEFPQAIANGRKLITAFPAAEPAIRRSAWLVVAHASFETAKYEEAEEGYTQVLSLTAEGDKGRAALVDNLAAAVYKQGEVAGKAKDFSRAAEHFLRVAQVAPGSKLRPTAEYDASAALIELKDWGRAAGVLQEFRRTYPKHELQPEVTKKIAFVYKESGQLALAAAEYERIETETKDDDIRRSALLAAADLYEQAKENDRAMIVYKRYVGYFPRPLELALETHNKLAELYGKKNDSKSRLAELKFIVDADGKAGGERTDRTRYLAAVAALALAEPLYAHFAEIKLVKPFDKNLGKKKAAMKEALDSFGKLTKYGVGEATAAATFYIAEVYYQFSRALIESERPTELSALELEQYEESIEEQAYPFEEKAIQIHEKNLELVGVGIYNPWVDKSLGKLAGLVPARYAKAEESLGYMASVDSFRYVLAAPEQAVAAVNEESAGGVSGGDVPSEPVDSPHAEQADGGGELRAAPGVVNTHAPVTSGVSGKTAL